MLFRHVMYTRATHTPAHTWMGGWSGVETMRDRPPIARSRSPRMGCWQGLVLAFSMQLQRQGCC
eukprot:12202987-Prorocentrum_lima.AAC.1